MEALVNLTLGVGATFASVRLDLPAVPGKMYEIDNFELLTLSQNTAASVPQLIAGFSSNCSRADWLITDGEGLAGDILACSVVDGSQYARDQIGGVLAANTLVDTPIFYSSVLFMFATGTLSPTTSGVSYANCRLTYSQVKATSAMLNLVQGRHSAC